MPPQQGVPSKSQSSPTCLPICVTPTAQKAQPKNGGGNVILSAARDQLRCLIVLVCAPAAASLRKGGRPIALLLCTRATDWSMSCCRIYLMVWSLMHCFIDSAMVCLWQMQGVIVVILAFEKRHSPSTMRWVRRHEHRYNNSSTIDTWHL